MELKYFVLRRALLLIPTLFGLTIFVFILLHAFPDQLLEAAYFNPHSPLPKDIQMQNAARLLGLNYPLPVQYFFYISNLFRGNWGFMNTQFWQGPVLQAIGIFFPNTAQLVIFSIVLSIVIAIPIGTYIGSKPNSVADQAGRVISLALYAMPVFVLGLILQAGLINWLSPNGQFNPLVVPYPLPGWLQNSQLGYFETSPTRMVFFDTLFHGSWALAWSSFEHLIEPTLTLTAVLLAGVLRFIRAGMVDNMYNEYVKTARSKGVPEHSVITHHVRKNALIPAVTVFGLLIAGLLGGVVITETMFQYPGVGLLTVNAALNYQIYGVMGTTFFFALILVVANLLVDIVYAFMDPRIRY